MDLDLLGQLLGLLQTPGTEQGGVSLIQLGLMCGTMHEAMPWKMARVLDGFATEGSTVGLGLPLDRSVALKYRVLEYLQTLWKSEAPGWFQPGAPVGVSHPPVEGTSFPSEWVTVLSSGNTAPGDRKRPH